jgi:hypothetical protein
VLACPLLARVLELELDQELVEVSELVLVPVSELELAPVLVQDLESEMVSLPHCRLTNQPLQYFSVE